MTYQDEKQRMTEGYDEEEIVLATHDYEITSEDFQPTRRKEARGYTDPQIIIDEEEKADPEVVFDVDLHNPYVGQVVAGRYEVQSLLGIGGMGRVCKGHQRVVERSVAIKILPSGPGVDESLAQRFHLEALATSRLVHPNTITVHDFGQTDDGSLFIVMEHLTGNTLEQVIEERPIVARVLRIALQSCGSLAEAHENGIVHRDLKPPNIIVSAIGNDKDWVKVRDFGLAKLVDSKLSFSVAGTVSGTPEYMSPEQVRGTDIDARSDIYTLRTVDV